MEIYVSTDVETDGPIPGPNSMLSFGSAAYSRGKELLGTFSANLETLSGAMAGLTKVGDNTQKFTNELGKLTDNLTSLNNVYGSMLTAMKGSAPSK